MRIRKYFDFFLLFPFPFKRIVSPPYSPFESSKISFPSEVGKIWLYILAYAYICDGCVVLKNPLDPDPRVV